MKNKAQSIPFMLIEPVKTEYRRLKAFKDHSDPRISRPAKALEIYTPGNENVSPIRFNPLQIPPGIGIGRDEHIANLLGCFMAAMPVSGPLPALLLEALEKAYEDYPDPDWPPMMVDLAEAANAVLACKGYSPETNSDIRSALEVRLGSLTHGNIGKVFQCRHSVPSIEHLMTVPSIIELNRLSAEQGCLLTLFELNAVREIVRVSPVRNDRPLFYAIGIEEAHVIIGRVGDAKPSEENPDTKAYATEFICRMLAELRGYNTSVIIIDQLPSAIAPEVRKITGSKLTLLHVDDEERQAIGGAMLLRKGELEDMGRLPPGHGFLFTQGYYRARKIKTVNLHEKLDLNSELSDDRLLAIIRQEEWFKQAATERISTELDQFKEYMDQYDTRKSNVANKVMRILRAYEFLLTHEDNPLKKRRLTAIAGNLRGLRKGLVSSYSQFKRGPYRMFSYLLTGEVDCRESELKALAESLNRRFESVIKSGTQGLLEVIGKTIRNCMRLKFKETDHVEKKKN
ncbi:MAG: hypothetical protein AMJ75_02270 [Phycisphaerae bacterium SM1_79]|nr:MAG: hypothetical protein AMJ75_02270 [Phycisphaerae bacterium SM1_79]